MKYYDACRLVLIIIVTSLSRVLGGDTLPDITGYSIFDATGNKLFTVTNDSSQPMLFDAHGNFLRDISKQQNPGILSSRKTYHDYLRVPVSWTDSYYAKDSTVSFSVADHFSPDNPIFQGSMSYTTQPGIFDFLLHTGQSSHSIRCADAQCSRINIYEAGAGNAMTHYVTVEYSGSHTVKKNTPEHTAPLFDVSFTTRTGLVISAANALSPTVRIMVFTANGKTILSRTMPYREKGRYRLAGNDLELHGIVVVRIECGPYTFARKISVIH